jgi:hypothetical protein
MHCLRCTMWFQKSCQTVYQILPAMNKLGLPLLLFFLFVSVDKVKSQDFTISQPIIQFDGNELTISYNLISKSLTGKAYLWVDISKKNGERISANSLSGDIGEIKVTDGNKKIVWLPEKDSIFLNEEIYIELKAEKYIKSFRKGTSMLASIIFPGWGQTKISKGKPYWLIGVVTYSGLGGGFIAYQNYLKTFEKYKIEEDPQKRADLSDKAQKQLNLSSALFISAASIWSANVLWVGFTPNKYKPLQTVKISLNPIYYPNTGNPVLLSAKINF